MRTPRVRRSADEVIAALRALANPANVAGMARFGISRDGTLGISVTTLRGIAKGIVPDHTLALALWDSGIHEARILAPMLDEPAKVTRRQMDRWARESGSWDICDGLPALFIRTPYAWEKVEAWAGRREQFVKRAAFSMLAALAVHDRDAADAVFIDALRLVEREADDDRNFVRKAVNWALRQIGKRNRALNREAVAAAERIRGHGTRAARWIAADALRELTGDAVQQRLRETAARRGKASA